MKSTTNGGGGVGRGRCGGKGKYGTCCLIPRQPCRLYVRHTSKSTLSKAPTVKGRGRGAGENRSRRLWGAGGDEKRCRKGSVGEGGGRMKRDASVVSFVTLRSVYYH